MGKWSTASKYINGFDLFEEVSFFLGCSMPYITKLEYIPWLRSFITPTWISYNVLKTCRNLNCRLMKINFSEIREIHVEINYFALLATMNRLLSMYGVTKKKKSY